MNTGTNENFEIYYNSIYWNDFPQVLEYMCENYTGDNTKWWVRDFKERYCAKPFELALSLNCGNGWVEREMIDLGIAKEIIAFDYSFDLLKIAESASKGRPIHYFQTDVNKLRLPKNTFDLVLNVAALHHVQYIDRLCQLLCNSLVEDGVMVSQDYFGPGRNQYPLHQWLLIKLFNYSLPANLRRPRLVYPHLPTMLHTDPTEAIHSDLSINTLERYFKILENHETGGGIVYEILAQNLALKNASKETSDHLIKNLLKFDKTLTRLKLIPSLFSYLIAKPEKSTLENKNKLSEYSQNEEQREMFARSHQGAYTRIQYWGLLLHKFQIQMSQKSRR